MEEVLWPDFGCENGKTVTNDGILGRVMLRQTFLKKTKKSVF